MKNSTVKSNFGKLGWLIIIFTLVIYLASSVPPDTLNVSVLAFGGKFGWDTNALLVFSGIGGFVGILISLIFGFIIAKYGVKWPTVIILIIYAFIWFFNGNVRSITQYGIAVVSLTAISNTINLVSTQQIMSNWFPRKKGIALGWATMGMCMSGAFMVPIFQKMFSISIGAPFYLMVAISLILAIITAIWFKSYPEQAGAYPDNIPISDEERKTNLKLIKNHKSNWTFSKLFKCKEFWYIVVIFGFLFLGLVGTVSQLIPRLMVVGLTQSAGILSLSVASIVGIFGSFAWGFIDQKIGTKKTVTIYCAIWTIMMICSAIGSQTMSIPISIISVVIFACMVGGLGNLMPSMVIQIFGRFDFSQANKYVVPFVVGIRSFALIIVSALLAATGKMANLGFRNVFIVFTILSLISLILSIIIKDKTLGKTI